MTDKEMIVRSSVKHLTLCGLDSPYGGLGGRHLVIKVTCLCHMLDATLFLIACYFYDSVNLYFLYTRKAEPSGLLQVIWRGTILPAHLSFTHPR